MPRKRKSGAPQRADESKRQMLAWNMADIAPDSFSVVANNDPSILKEFEEALRQQSAGQFQRLENDAETTAAVADVPLQEVIDGCDYYISVYNKVLGRPDDWHCKLGTASFTVTNTLQLGYRQALPSVTEFWLYVNTDTHKHCVYFEVTRQGKQANKDVLHFEVTTKFPLQCLEALQMKCFCMTLEEFNHQHGELKLNIYALSAALTKLKFNSDGSRLKKVHIGLQGLMAYFYGLTPADYSGKPLTKRHDIDSLYGEIKRRHEMSPLQTSVNVQHVCLKPRLREYQKAGVRWMLAREAQTKVEEGKLHSLYCEVTMADGKVLYYCKEGGYLVEERPVHQISPPGGILADQMGLGKTVEVLSCMLANPRTDLLKIAALPVAEVEGHEGKVNVTGDESEVKPQVVPEVTEDLVNECEVTEVDSRLPTEENTKVEAVSQEKSGIEGEHNYAHQDPNYVATTYCQTEQGAEKVVSGQDVDCQQEVEVGSIWDTPLVEQAGSTMGNCDGSVGSMVSLTEQDNCESLNCDPPVIDITGDEINSSNDDSDIQDVTPVKKVTKPKRRKQKRISFGKKKTKRRKPTSDQTVAEVQQPKKSLSCKSSTKNPKVKLVEEDTVEEGYWEARPKACFECVCGRHEWEEMGPEGGLRVQCEGCGTWQHPHCVHYDLTDPFRGHYLCPHCHVASPPLQSGATLIISPNSICHQWVDEIHKHIHQQAIKVMVYTGVQKQGFIQPQTLASKDIVITTYETLRKEIDYVDLPHTNSEAGRRFRHPKRFMAIPSPIIAVQWWRICLDEAQMVECTTTKTAEMALRLSAVNRWCVTGTPIQKGIDDLYGLLLFLGVDPYWVHHWWNKLLYEPYCYGDKERLLKVISKVMWRTAKNDVLDQICLPLQSEEMHLLTFTPVEEHFYRRQYHSCAREAMKNLSKWTDSDTKLNTLDRYTLHQLLHPLLRLRQACCHPQVVRGEFLPIHKSTLSMEELLEQLTKKTRVEGEEAHRQYVAAVNGLAALHFIQDQLTDAVDRYREALRSIEEHKDRVRTDELQQLHTLHNLKEVLDRKPAGIAPTLRDHQLMDQACEIREKYLAKAAAFVSQTQDAWAPLHRNLADLHKQFRGGEEWWADLLQWVMYAGLDFNLIDKVKDELSENSSSQIQSLANSFRDVRGLEYVLASHLEQLDQSHERLVTTLRKLSAPPSRQLINETVECCLRPADESNIPKTCPFCKAHEIFEEYESKLFSFVDKGVTETGSSEDHQFLVSTRRQGTWADSEMEKTLKILISFAKSYSADRESIEFGNLHIKVLDALKKEFKTMRTVWMALREQVSAFDELDMATMRFRLRLPDEPRTEAPQPYVLDKGELEQQRMKLLSDRIIGQNDLRRKLGQLLYLQNLAKAQNSLEGGQNPEPCPVCQGQLGNKWSVLQCGHCYCLECVRILVDSSSVGGRRHGSLKCPVCRQRTPLADISYVSTRSSREAEAEGSEVKVKGDNSTKIAGVVKCLINIRKEDPTAKALVFSTWQDVLDVLGQALAENDIPYRSLLAHHKFQDNLKAFKQQAGIPVLLLPVHSGANGLNLIEATHVLLVEPILNPAQEQQAIGRVHRIGQTRPTVVHRFLVKGTIEERMHSLLQSIHTPVVNSHNAEETPLTIGDLSSLFTEMPEEEEEEEENMDPAAEEQSHSQAQGQAESQSHAESQIHVESQGQSESQSQSEAEDPTNAQGHTEGQEHTEEQSHAEGQGHTEYQGHVEGQGHPENKSHAEGQGHAEEQGHAEGQGHVKVQGLTEGQDYAEQYAVAQINDETYGHRQVCQSQVVERNGLLNQQKFDISQSASVSQEQDQVQIKQNESVDHQDSNIRVQTNSYECACSAANEEQGRECNYVTDDHLIHHVGHDGLSCTTGLQKEAFPGVQTLNGRSEHAKEEVDGIDQSDAATCHVTADILDANNTDARRRMNSDSQGLAGIHNGTSQLDLSSTNSHVL